MVALNRESLQEKILDGRRVSAAEALSLYRWPLAELGALADARRNFAKEKHYGNRGREIVTYIVASKSTTPTSATFTASSARFIGPNGTTIITFSRANSSTKSWMS